MALSNTHTNWEKGSYLNDRDYQIKILENDKLYASIGTGTLVNLDAHVDGCDSLAMGYGYDLFKNVDNLVIDLQELVFSKQSGVLVADALAPAEVLTNRRKQQVTSKNATILLMRMR